jgi:hypothetical protein
MLLVSILRIGGENPSRHKCISTPQSWSTYQLYVGWHLTDIHYPRPMDFNVQKTSTLCTQYQALRHWNILTSVFWEIHEVVQDIFPQFPLIFYNQLCYTLSTLFMIIVLDRDQNSRLSVSTLIGRSEVTIKENCLRSCYSLLGSQWNSFHMVVNLRSS